MILVRPDSIHLAPGPSFVRVRARIVSVQAGPDGARLRLALEGSGGRALRGALPARAGPFGSAEPAPARVARPPAPAQSAYAMTTRFRPAPFAW